MVKERYAISKAVRPRFMVFNWDVVHLLLVILDIGFWEIVGEDFTCLLQSQ